MKRLFILWILACLVAVAPAQQTRKTSTQRRTTTTKSRTAAKKTTPQRKKTTQKKKKTTKKPGVTVNSLKSEQTQVRKEIKEQERRLRANEQDVQKRLQNLMVINNEIADKRKTIDTIRHDITRLDVDIQTLRAQLKMLEQELVDRKQRYKQSMRYMHRTRSIQSQMLFVFSAKNFSQMYRRLRFVREYAAYQQAQGEAVMSMQTQVEEAYKELASTKRQKNALLNRGEQERRSLENKQVEQQKVVTSLKKEQKTIQGIIDKQKKRIVASRKQVIEEENAAKKAAAWEKLEEGAVVTGIVRRFADFGAFVDLGGVDGLIHITDLAWSRVGHPSEVLQVNQEVEVKILSLDRERERIQLGYKQLQPKPWDNIEEKYPVGTILERNVVRIRPFGAFIELEPGVDGLVHISQCALTRIAKVEDVLEVGQPVRVKVLAVDPEAKRISLSIREALADEAFVENDNLEIPGEVEEAPVAEEAPAEEAPADAE